MKTIISNLKMNLCFDKEQEYIKTCSQSFSNEKVEFVVAPSFLSVSQFKCGKIKMCAQDVSDEEKGAYTGEVCAKSLSQIKADYVLVGHSERRSKFKESNLKINKKIKNSLKEGLKPIVCIGESLKDKNNQKTQDVLSAQIQEGLKGLYENELSSLIIAYEPVWAIGSGKAASLKDVKDACELIRRVVGQQFSKKAGGEIRIVYGGSVNLSNFHKILNVKGVDGLLVGGFGLDSISFVKEINKIK